MKQKTKGASEFDLLSKARKKGYLTAKPGTWKALKRKMSRRFRKEGRMGIRKEDRTEEAYD